VIAFDVETEEPLEIEVTLLGIFNWSARGDRGRMRIGMRSLPFTFVRGAGSCGSDGSPTAHDAHMIRRTIRARMRFVR